MNKESGVEAARSAADTNRKVKKKEDGLQITHEAVDIVKKVSKNTTKNEK